MPKLYLDICSIGVKVNQLRVHVCVSQAAPDGRSMAGARVPADGAARALPAPALPAPRRAPRPRLPRTGTPSASLLQALYIGRYIRYCKHMVP
jgi:hypothetical protein